jgi:hypothetical protein
MSLVNVLLGAGDLGNATIQASSVLTGCKRVFSDTHPTTLAILVNSAAVLRASATHARRAAATNGP